MVLTQRQHECLTRHIEGKSTRQIARELGISQPTVATHLRKARLRAGLPHPEPRELRGCKMLAMDPADIDNMDPRRIRAAV